MPGKTSSPGKSSRTGALRTRTGALRGQRCQAVVSQWRQKEGDGLCSNNADESGYCSKHKYLTENKTRGQREVIERYRKIGVPMKVSPVQALGTLISESAGNVEFLRNEVQNLEKLVIAGRKTRDEISGAMLLYNEERDRHERYVLDAMRIRLDERKHELTVTQATVFAALIKQFIDFLGLMGEQRQTALTWASQQLKVIDIKVDDEWDGPLQEANRVPLLREKSA